MMSGEIRLRSATVVDADFLVDMLVQAVNWSSDRRLSHSFVAADPVLGGYVDGWPDPGDLGVVAETDEGLVGAVWLRSFTVDAPGYGYVADDVPELSMAVVEAWRNRGIGRSLLQDVAQRARVAGHHAISLSVERANTAAHRLYTDEGFQIVKRDADMDTMLLEL